MKMKGWIPYKFIFLTWGPRWRVGMQSISYSWHNFYRNVHHMYAGVEDKKNTKSVLTIKLEVKNLLHSLFLL